MPQHVIVGAGPIGSALARRLADRDGSVTVVTRSGSGPDHPAVTRVSADAADADLLAGLADGAATLTNCANPGTYQQWEREWPPLAAALLAAAERSGAVLCTMSNLYGYGPVDIPLTTDLPLAATGHKGRLRARMWQDALAAHEAGRIRAVEVRAADYIGPEVTAAGGMIRRYADAALRGRAVTLFGRADVPHSFSYAEDVAETLAVAAAEPQAWGRAWHVPGAQPRTVRQTLTDLMAAAGVHEPLKIHRVPRPLLTAVSPVVPIVKELTEVLWQFERPFVLDATATTDELGVAPAAWSEVIGATARAWASA